MKQLLRKTGDRRLENCAGCSKIRFLAGVTGFGPSAQTSQVLRDIGGLLWVIFDRRDTPTMTVGLPLEAEGTSIAQASLLVLLVGLMRSRWCVVGRGAPDGSLAHISP
jgi:hypothetical protein